MGGCSFSLHSSPERANARIQPQHHTTFFHAEVTHRGVTLRALIRSAATTGLPDRVFERRRAPNSHDMTQCAQTVPTPFLIHVFITSYRSQTNNAACARVHASLRARGAIHGNETSVAFSETCFGFVQRLDVRMRSRSWKG